MSTKPFVLKCWCCADMPELSNRKSNVVLFVDWLVNGGAAHGLPKIYVEALCSNHTLEVSAELLKRDAR